MTTKKEEFIQSFVDAVRKKVPGVDTEVAERLGGELWMGREINYSVVDDKNFNLLAHRYFHGVGNAHMQVLLATIPEELAMMMPLILSEHMFAYGFMCGVANERGWDVDTVAPAAEAIECLADRENILRTREELDQDDALPSALLGESEDALPEGFNTPPSTPPDIENGF